MTREIGSPEICIGMEAVGIVLGEMKVVRQSLILSDGSLLTFFTRLIAAFFMLTARPFFPLPPPLPSLAKTRRRVAPQKA